jgi:hypothetical protein
MNIDVFYLIRFKDSNYHDRLNNFLLSYKNNRAGVRHQLNIIFKGFSHSDYTIKIKSIEKKYKLSFKSFFHDDLNFDIGSYISVARSSSAEYLFFLNSSSQILTPNWLKKFYVAYRNENIGLVGATGSAEKLDHFWFLPSPNYHVRTNAFFIKNVLFKEITKDLYSFPSKNSVWKFESGSQSFTKKILMKNLKCVIVGRDGLIYPMPLWFMSNTFKSGDQSNLIIADNQTETYRRSSKVLKNHLAYKAWGINGDITIF